MPAPISSDLRARVVAAFDAEEGTREQIAARFSVSDASIGRWVRLKRDTGSVDPLPMGTHKKARFDDPDELESLDLIVFDHPTATLKETVELFVKEGGERVSTSTIGRGLARLGITRKKTVRSRRNKIRQG